ncbi:putative cytochrome P450 [Cyberlindnera jadinii NRRL Y-1542]|uniref:Cytochrome P450 n=1 Tax=Cyberlindnera jadinii (strain ATCC 18201 / CBS 1600 / BCRC 20928 / JCM 3617 / NBRC 0987 / NRRL Y-1542) TaxID=983966 RepID=A0A1E4RV81_CYBJN|nr:cytochrome P450 [Cyberlindnera jadinii NRRL Y-1542]ODV71121.1 cytochrome P450 [Cyberlindnera jadinii NRRL Y-1542]
MLTAISITISLLLAYALARVVFPPWSFPRNIPTVPFYVSFLGTYTSLDQRQIYERYIRPYEKYGAVKIYFANRWNVLVIKPELLQQVFRDETTFAKSGNHRKIPRAVLSQYTGDNVISAHGADWKLYRGVIQKAIQFPVKSHLYTNTLKFVELIRRDCSVPLYVSDYLQRLSLANVSMCMLGVDFHTLELDCTSELHMKLKLVKSHIFKPLYMNFPILDSLPIPSRLEARRQVESFRSYYTEQVMKAQVSGDSDVECAAFQLYTAFKQGKITAKQMTDNLVIILVAGHENPQLLFTSLLYMLAKYPTVQHRVRQEISQYDVEFVEQMPFLTSVLFETLRFFPPLGQIINRCTSKDTLLGDCIHIPKGTYVGYNNYSTTHSSSWQEADSFKPERWGTEMEDIMDFYKHCKSSSTLPTFHGGKRACLGERFAILECKIFVYQVVKNFELALDPNWVERITPAGPICPFNLKIIFKPLA